MNITKPTAKELWAWLAITNPTGSRNKYNTVRFDRTDKMVYCTYNVAFGSNAGVNVDKFTKEQFVELCGFDNFEHYKAMRTYMQNRITFDTLKQGMIVYSESERQRYRISTRRNKDEIYASRLSKLWKRNTKLIIITRNFFDNGFFKKSELVPV